MPICPSCQSPFADGVNLRRHQQLAARCRKGSQAVFDAALRNSRIRREAAHNRRQSPGASVGGLVNTTQGHEEPEVTIAGHDSDIEMGEAGPGASEGMLVEDLDDCDAIVPRVQDVVDDDSVESIKSRKRSRHEPYPEDRAAGASHGHARTSFERIRDEEVLTGAAVWGPFRDEEEWELAKWLIKNVGHTQADTFLKLPIINNRACPSFSNKDQFLNKIDGLSTGVRWKCVDLEIEGDQHEESKNNVMRKENVELWFRDPVELVEELIGNPAFRDVIKYAPERVYEGTGNETQVIDEMWTGEWWWNVQNRLKKGATVAPIILSSDKTMLSNFRGDNSAWPVYLTIGNIGKETRRQVSSHATVLVGYLPIPKFDCFDVKTRSLAKYRLFHACMDIIMEPLTKAGIDGKEMVCADSLLRDVWPIFAAYVADYPEQCLVACCMENRCPICQVDPNARGSHTGQPKREVKETLFYLRRKNTGETDTAFKTMGLRAVAAPFWRRLPHSDIFHSFTPDLLHQLHKGVFKDHLVKWVTEIISKEELDTRFRSAPSHHGLRHFKNGISHVSQWTGTEHKEMEKVFLALVASHQNEQLVIAVRSLIDFIYLASLQSHTTHTLLALRDALNTFHTNKQVFIDLGGRSPEHFNIPKVHSLDHYEELIRLFGSADGFNTESPERLHIDFAKNAYRASNRKDYIQQMTRWLERQEMVDHFSSFLVWNKGQDLGKAISSGKIDQQSHEAASHEADDLIATSRFTLAKKPPPASRHVLASDIISPDGHGASRFIPALSSFLASHGSSFLPRPFDVFGLWKQIVFKLPNIPEVGRRHLTNIVRASGPIVLPGAGRRRQEQPAHLDFAFIQTAETNPFTENTPLQGLRIAQVHAIFQLPTNYPGPCLKIPLAYVEWFTPLRNPDSVTGYYHISRSTRRHEPYAEIITVDRIVRNAMLVPNPKKNGQQYFLNSHIDGHSFCMMKLKYHGCVP